MLSFYFQSDTARNKPDDSDQEPAEIVAEHLASYEVSGVLMTNHHYILLLTWSDDLFYL